MDSLQKVKEKIQHKINNLPKEQFDLHQWQTIFVMSRLIDEAFNEVEAERFCHRYFKQEIKTNGNSRNVSTVDTK